MAFECCPSTAFKHTSKRDTTHHRPPRNSVIGFGSRGVCRSEDRLLKSGPELQIGITQLAREGSPPPGLRRPQAKLSGSSN
jgi:hypothetical protein